MSGRPEAICTSYHPNSYNLSVGNANEILFKDEKYKDETIDILTQLMTDGNLSGDNQVS